MRSTFQEGATGSLKSQKVTDADLLLPSRLHFPTAFCSRVLGAKTTSYGHLRTCCSYQRLPTNHVYVCNQERERIRSAIVPESQTDGEALEQQLVRDQQLANPLIM